MFDVSTFVSKVMASAANFQFPVDVLASDQAIYDRSESWEAAIAKKQAGSLENSINPARVRRVLVHHHSDCAAMLETATYGAAIDEPKGFVRQPWPDPPIEVMLKLPNSILMHIMRFYYYAVECLSRRGSTVQACSWATLTASLETD